MASTVHQTWGWERNFPSRGVGCLPARPLASALRRLAPFTESFLLRQLPSCFPAGPRIYTGLSCPARAPVFLFILPLCPVSVLFPYLDEPPNVLPDVRIPEREEGRLPRQCNLQKKGRLLLTRARAPAASNALVQGQRARSPSCYINL